jgi:hypothetical protein
VHERKVHEWIEKPEIDILAGIGVLAIEPKSIDVLANIVDINTSLDIMGGLIPELLKK